MTISQDRLADLLQRTSAQCELLSREASELQQEQLKLLLDMVVMACDDQLDLLERPGR